MTAVLNELSEKKVSLVDTPFLSSLTSEFQIEGFKLHVTHNIRPFTKGIRFTPEVASKPDRIQKDLANAKILASILEEEAGKLRQLRLPPAGARVDDQSEDQAVIPSEAEDDDPEPKEMGSEAVERRIEKVMSELRDRNLVDVNNEKAYEEKKVNYKHSCSSLYHN
jgi:hypothetical protein